jgi:Spy/CpxP family protein refolding chaperone
MVLSKVRVAAVTLGLLSAPLMAAPSVAACGMGMGGGHGAMMMGMHGGGMMGMHGGSPFMMLLKSANLTAAQQQQVQLILNSDKAKMQGLHQQLFSLHEQISAKLFGTGAVTSADLKPLVQQASRIEADLNQNMADTALAIRNVLTPDQVKHLADVHQKLHNLHAQIQGLMGGSANDGSDDN